MATLQDLFKLTINTSGEPNAIASRLLLEALDKLDWKTLDGNLLTPLSAAYETLPHNPAIAGYKSLLMKTSDYCRSLQEEAEKVPHLQTAFENLRREHEKLKAKLVAAKKPAEVQEVACPASGIISSPSHEVITCNNPIVVSSQGNCISSGVTMNSLNQVAEVKYS